MKLRIALAAVVAATVALPAIASAETVVIRHGDRDHVRGARAEFHHDRGWHRGWDRDRRHGHRTVIITRHGGDRD